MNKIILFAISLLLLCCGKKTSLLQEEQVIEKYLSREQVIVDTTLNPLYNDKDSILETQMLIHGEYKYLLNRIHSVNSPCIGVGCTKKKYNLLSISSLDTLITRYTTFNEYIGSTIGLVNDTPFILIFKNPSHYNLQYNLNSNYNLNYVLQPMLINLITKDTTIVKEYYFLDKNDNYVDVTKQLQE